MRIGTKGNGDDNVAGFYKENMIREVMLNACCQM